MKIPRPSHRSQVPHASPAGFSLLEVMVATAVLALLGLLIAQITINSQRLVQISNTRMDAEGQAGMVADRLLTDLGGLLERADVDFVANNTGPGGNFRLRMITAVPAAGDPAGGNRNISVVAWEIAPHAETEGRPCLVRAAKPLGWEQAEFLGNNAQGQPLSLMDSGFPVTIAEGDYDVLAEGVFRLVVGFQLVPDQEPVTLLDGTQLAEATGQLVYSPPVRALSGGGTSGLVDTARISSLVIGMVALDVPGLRRLDSTALNTLTAAFPQPAAGESPSSVWNPIALNVAGTAPAIPQSARQALRVYERAIPLAGSRVP